MDNKSKAVIIALIFVVIIGVLYIWNSQQKKVIVDHFPPASPIHASLSLSSKPLLNTPVTLTLTFISDLNASNVSAKIELPEEGFELINGSLEWHGNLKENETQKIEAVIKSTKVGYYKLRGYVVWNGRIQNSSVIYVEVSQNDAIIGSKPKNNWGQTPLIPHAENNEQIKSELLISQNPELGKEFVITYRVTPLIDLPDPQRTQMSLVFPPGAFEIVDVYFPEGGETFKQPTQLSWKGTINKGQTVEIKAIFKVTNTGWGPVYGELMVQPSGTITNPIIDAKIAELYVDKYGGNFTIKNE